MAISTTVSSTKQIEKLRQRLGVLDNERRQILEAIRNNPENIKAFTEQTINDMIKSNQWYEKKTSKETIYSQLLSVKEIKSVSPYKKNERIKRPIVSAELTWNIFSESSISPSTTTTTIYISVFGDIEPQILNGFKKTTMTEKELKKKILNIQETSLKEQLKQIQLEIKKIK